jgi:uncharacterized alpha-E superfamily protein
MLSRTAENLYWLGRHLERAENAARMVDVEYHAAIESGAASAGDVWDALITATGAWQAFEHAKHDTWRLSPGDFLVLAPENPNSIRSLVERARFLARILREHISREVWLEINELHLDLQDHPPARQIDLFDLCNTVKRRIETIFGLYDNTVLFDEGRDWFRCGFYIERADMTSRILDAKYHILLPAPSEVGGTLDRFQWTAILRSASASEAFRKSNEGAATGPRVANMLIFSPAFPRSLTFCTLALLRHYRNATRDTPPAMRAPAERELVLIQLDLQAVTIEEVIERGLHEFLKEIQDRFIEADRVLGHSIFRALPEKVR